MKKHLPLIIILLLIAGSVYYLESGKTDISGGVKNADIQVGQVNTSAEAMTLEKKAEKYERAKEIVQPGQFFNTENHQPVTIQELIGKKVVMVDFWTYSCINCQRTTPYLNAWHNKYADEGLVILGLHSPEFDFEKDPANVQDAIDRFGIEYPVIQDNEFGTWRAYQNRYWPRKYLIDIDGFIVYDHIGEGAYAKTEQKIQELLKERAERLNESVDFVAGQYVDLSAPKKVSNKRISPEIYFGAWRNEYLGNGEKNKLGAQSLTLSEYPKDDVFYLEGEWLIEEKFAENKSDQASVHYNYNANDVFMVASAGQPVKVKVMVGGMPIKPEMAGEDVDEQGYITVKEERLYKIINDSENFNSSLTLIIEQPGLNLYTFTFG